MLVRALLVIAAFAASAAAAPAWSVVPPPGWTETTEETLAAQGAEIRKRLPPQVEYELRVWQAEEGTLNALYVTMPGMGAPDAVLRGWEDGASRELAAGQTAYTRNDTPKLLRATQASTIEGQDVFVARRAGMHADGKLRGLQVSCAGPRETCEMALSTVTLDEASFVTLPKASASGGSIDSSSSAYKLGQLTGAVLLVLLVVWVVARVRRSEK